MRKIAQRKTNEEFIRQLNEINQNIEALDEYVSAKTKIRFRCKICGNIWDATPDNILRGTGCPKCAGNIKKTTEDLKKELELINPDIICLDEYQGYETKIQFKGLKCNHVWETTPASILQGNRCPECNKLTIAKRFIKSHEQFIKDAYKNNPDITILGKYTKAKDKILCKCNICDFEWNPIADSVVRGYGCPKCFGKHKTTEEFKQEILVIHPDIVIEGEYINAKSIFKCTCKKCHYQWSSTANNLKYHGCSQCGSSHGEKRIKMFLENKGVNFIPQKTYDTLLGVGGRRLSYDFYLPEYNLLIEYQGNFHDGTARIQTEEQFEIQQEHDKRKREYAQLHNINLLEIWYYDIDNIESILLQTINNLKLESVETAMVV